MTDETVKIVAIRRGDESDWAPYFEDYDEINLNLSDIHFQDEAQHVDEWANLMEVEVTVRRYELPVPEYMRKAL